MVLRDRNHPSVVIWSICNEILCMGFNATAARMLVAEIKRLDPEGGRVVSAAQNMEYDVKREFGESLDLFGVNYNILQYDLWHAQYPQQPMIARCVRRSLLDQQLEQNTRCMETRAHKTIPSRHTYTHTQRDVLGPERPRRLRQGRGQGLHLLLRRELPALGRHGGGRLVPRRHAAPHERRLHLDGWVRR